MIKDLTDEQIDELTENYINKMTEIEAKYIKFLRIVCGYTWRKIHEVFIKIHFGDIIFTENQLVGREICDKAKQILKCSHKDW